MKIRTGFVSNSSSSSFIIDDKNVKLKEVEKFMNNLSEFYKANFDTSRDPDSYYIEKITREYINMDYSSYDKSDLNKIVINESGDNSLPHSYEYLIEEKFDSRRIYHG